MSAKILNRIMIQANSSMNQKIEMKTSQKLKSSMAGFLLGIRVCFEWWNAAVSVSTALPECVTRAG
jgi:hypothetical protein